MRSSHFLIRESCKVDRLPFVDQIRARLKSSYSILSDMLPSHVVTAMLEATSVTAKVAEQSYQNEPTAEELDFMPSRSGMSLVIDRLKGLFSRPSSRSSLSAADPPSHVAASSPPEHNIAAAVSSPSSRRLDKLPPTTTIATIPFVAVLPDLQAMYGSNIGRSLLAPAAAPLNSQAESHECVTLFFSDIVGFSSWAHSLTPAEVMNTLNDLYTRLDDIILNEMPSLYKVETIGDA